MKDFLLYSLVFIVAVGCFSKLLYFSIQDGQIFGFWQKKLQKFAEKGYTLLHHWGGGCEVCYCVFISILSIPFYLYFMQNTGLWAIDNMGCNFLWILLYFSLTVNGNLFFLHGFRLRKNTYNDNRGIQQ